MPTVELLSVADWEARHPGVVDDPIKKALQRVYQSSTIYDGFDHLVSLIDLCNQLLKINPQVKDIQDLKSNALEFVKAIVDAKDEADLNKKIADRNHYKTFDPEYMPWNAPSTRTDITKAKNRKQYLQQSLRKMVKNLHGQHYSIETEPEESKLTNFGEAHPEQLYNFVNIDDSLGDIKAGVRYLKQMKDRERYRIFSAQGKLKKIALSRSGRLSLNDFDTEKYQAHGNADKAIFVVSPKGDMFAGVTINDQFYHSTFLGGGATFYAGTMSVVNGEVRFIDDWSGHYKPTPEKLVRMLAFMHKAKLLSEKTKTDFFSIPEIKAAKNEKSLPTIDLKKLQQSIIKQIDSQFPDPLRRSAATQFILSSEATKNATKLLNRFLDFQAFVNFVTKLQDELNTNAKDYSQKTLSSIINMINECYQDVVLYGRTDYFSKQFFDAIDTNDIETVHFLLNAGFDVYPKIGSERDIGSLALYKAVAKGNIEMAEMLLTCGAFPSSINPENGETPLLCALKLGNAAMANLLLDHHVDPFQTNTSGITPIRRAAHKGLDSVVQRLNDAAAIFEHNISQQEEPLLFTAIKQNKPDRVKQLLAAGANINQVGRDGVTTPLLLAAAINNINIVRLLIDNGANIMVFLKEANKEAMDLDFTKLLLSASPKEKIQSAWQEAVSVGDNDVVTLLFKAGIDLNEPLSDNKSLLYHAAETGNRFAVNLLLNAGVKPDTQCLDIAKKNHHVDCVNILDKALVQTIMPEILALKVKSTGSLLPLQTRALTQLHSLALQQTYENALLLLNAYRELEVLAKNMIPYKTTFFQNFSQPNRVKQTSAIHKAITDAYNQFNKASNVTEAVKCVQQLEEAIQNARGEAIRKRVDSSLVNLIDRSINEVRTVSKPHK